MNSTGRFCPHFLGFFRSKELSGEILVKSPTHQFRSQQKKGLRNRLQLTHLIWATSLYLAMDSTLDAAFLQSFFSRAIFSPIN